MKHLLLFAIAALGVAEASVIPILVGSGGVNCGVQSGVWGCDYNYTAKLHDNARLTANQSGHEEYFTFYDFNGIVSASVANASDWSITIQPTGITPSNINASSFDLDDVQNVTFKYIGGVDVAAGSSLGMFLVRSTFGPAVTWGRFSSQATQTNGELFVQNTGNVQIAVPYRSDFEPVPEPMTMALFGSGLIGLGLFKRIRN